MNKFLKLLAPVIMSIYLISLFAGPGWGKEGDITAKVEIPGGLDQGTSFVVKAILFKENSSGTKNPILENGAVKIDVPEGFNIQSESTVEGQHIYKIVAPMKEGEFPVTLIYDNQKEAPTKFNYLINVINPSTYYLQAVLGIGAIAAITLTLCNTLLQSWKR